MKSKDNIWWALSISIGIFSVLAFTFVVLFWYQSIQQNRSMFQELLFNYGHYIFTACLALIACLAFLLARSFRAAIIPMNKLSEEVELIYSVNSSHRIGLTGTYGFRRLVEKINAAAERYEKLERSVFERVQIAKAELEEEKNILAAIMAELPDAVLICNKEGQIILYNTQAKHYFNEQAGVRFSTPEGALRGSGAAAYEEQRFLGIGRSIFGLIDKNIIQHALDEMHDQLARQKHNVVASFVLTARGNRLLRAETVPILTARRKFSGFIIIFNDITQGLRVEARAEFLLRSFQDKIRHSLSSIRSAIDIIVDYPKMEESRYKRLTEIIQKEAEDLGHLINREADETYRQGKQLWPLVPVSTAGLLESFKKKAEGLLGIRLEIEKSKGEGRVKVDTYTMLLVLLFLLDHIIKASGQIDFSCSYSGIDKLVYIDIAWQGKPIKIENLRKWEAEELHIEREGLPLYLKEVLYHHTAEIWSYTDRKVENRSCLRLFLPAYHSYETDVSRQVAVLPENRPEFYNFDLFNQPGQTPDIDDCLLEDLTYTVFDTETTGLDPAGGDRIISIAAVRILKQHILREESFDELINPDRDIPAESTKIHGIDDDMVRFKPGIENILPIFHQFAADTILVAHNAAFDMRMLQTYEAQTGMEFINPVLDTLLLSAVVHPNQENHTLEAIAARLGVDIVHRHTAMGDAITTSEIFLKLVPLLESLGLRTMKEVREASEKTYYARLSSDYFD